MSDTAPLLRETLSKNQYFLNAQRYSNKQHHNSVHAIHSITISIPLIDSYKIAHARYACLCLTKVNMRHLRSICMQFPRSVFVIRYYFVVPKVMKKRIK